MRVYLLFMVVAILSVYAWRDWFKSLCGLIAILAVIEHPDVPRSLGGVPGLNPFNILLMAVVGGWALNRRRERLRWDMPGFMTVLLLLYAGVVVVSTLRMLASPAPLEDSLVGLVNDYVLNTGKWVVPGLLLFDGVRSQHRFDLGVLAVLSVYVVLALQIARWITPGYILDSGALERRSRKILNAEIGLYRTNLAMMMAGGAWAILAARDRFRAWWMQLALTGASALVVWALLLTAGRAGYVTWLALALFFSVVRWRLYLLLGPLLLVAALSVVPGAVDRMTEGLSQDQMAMEGDVDRDAVTAGRTNIWPYVVEKIAERPLEGHGREAMQRTGLTAFGLSAPDVQEGFGHPHNLYLEILLDTGIVGFVPVMLFYTVMVFIALRLFLDRRASTFSVAGGVALALLLSFLVSGIGGRHLYPEEITAPMWCSIGLLLRAWVERRRITAAGLDAAEVAPPATAPAQWASRARPRKRPADLDDRLWQGEGGTA